jgi:hypothetical protein
MIYSRVNSGLQAAIKKARTGSAGGSAAGRIFPSWAGKNINNNNN